MKLDIKKLETHYGHPAYEGRFGHMYLDGLGHVTIGVGHLLYQRPRSQSGIKLNVTSINGEQRVALSKVNFLITIEYKDPKKAKETRKPTPSELEYAFMKVASRNAGYLGRAYRKFSNLAYKDHASDWPDYKDAQIYISDSEISRIFTEDIETKVKELKQTFRFLKGNQFDLLPDKVQEALIDMSFNLGANGLKKKFPSFMDAIAKGDYLKASKESKRSGIQDSRNDYVKNLLIDAAKTKSRVALP